MEKLKVLHLFISKSRVHFIRTLLLTFSNRIEYFVATPKCSKVVKNYKDRYINELDLNKDKLPLVQKKYEFEEILNKSKFLNGHVICYGDVNSLLKTFEINNLKFDVVLVSDCPTLVMLRVIYTLFGYLPQVFFVAHGITVIEPTPDVFDSWNPYFTYISSSGYQLNALIEPTTFMNKKYIRRVYEIKGLPQFDYMMLMVDKYQEKYNQYEVRSELGIPLDGKVVLIVIGIEGNIDGIIKMIDLIHEEFPNHYIIVRNKTCNFVFPKKYTYVRVATLERVSYDYFFADVNVIYVGGTSFLECMFYNPCTINYQCDNKQIGRENVGIFGYNYLLTSNTIDEFKKHLKLTKTNYVHTKEYVDDIKRYMLEYCNTECIEYTSERIIDIILQEYKEKKIDENLQSEIMNMILNEPKPKKISNVSPEKIMYFKNSLNIRCKEGLCKYIPDKYDLHTADYYIDMIAMKK
jgi:hypothetical protein